MTAEGSIDQLTIEVSSTAASAVRDIRDLSQALAGLKGSIGRTAAKLTGIADSVSSLKRASAGLQLGGLRQLEGLTINSAIGRNLKTMAAAVSLMPSDTHSRIAPLAALKALDGVKMSTSVGSNLAKIATALAFMPTDTASRLAGLPTLKYLNGVKISSSVPSNLTKLAQAVNSFPTDSGTRLAGLAKALLPLKQLNGMKITTALNGLRELPGVLKKYETLNVKNLVAQLELLNPRLKELAVSANALKMAFNKMPSSLRTVASATRTVVSANKQLETSQNSVGRSTTSLIAKFGSLNMAFHYMWNGLAKCIHEVNTFIENMNLFQASMGQYTESATEFGNKVQDAMGIDFGQWARNQGVFQTLITGMGDTADRAAVMSQQLTQLGYDISSFYNISVEDAMLKLQSGMAGELEPLRRLGWDLSNARMQLEATKLGIDANVQSMTQAEKVGLRYYLIMNQVTQVHGDMARTIASPANQLRILQAQVTLAARAIGGLLIPMLNTILPYAIAAAKAIRMLAQTIANFLGIDATFEIDYSNLDLSGIATGNEEIEDTADALGDAGDAAEEAAKKVEEYKNTVMGFDELNKLNDVPEHVDNGGAGAGGAGAGPGAGAGGGGFDLPLDTYDFLDGLNDYLTKLSDDLANKMVDALKKIVPIVAGIGAGFATWKIGKGLLDAAGKLGAKLGTASKNASSLANNLVKAGKTTVGSKLDNMLGGISRALGSASGFLLSMAANAGKFAPIIAGVAAVVAVMVARTADLWINSEKFRDGVMKIYEWLSQIPDIVVGIPGVFKEIAEWAGKVWENIKQWAESLGIDLSFLDPVLGAFRDLAAFIGDNVMGVVEALDLDFADLGITVAGLALIFSGIGAPLGIALLVFEGITLAIRAIGWATEDCVEHVDALADVSEETAEKFGTSLDSMEGAIKEIDEIDFSDAVVTEEDVASVTEKCEDIRDTILNNLDAKRNEELAQIEAMAGFLTPEEVEAAKRRVNEAYDQQRAEVESGTAEITNILMSAKDKGVTLSQEQSDRINEILDAQYAQLIATSGASQEEIDKISQAMANNQEAAALQAAESVISEAQRVRDERLAAAEEDYQNQVDVANKLYEAGDIDKKRCDEIIATAERQRDMTIQHANEQYDGILKETEEGLGDVAYKFDFNTGKIRENWDMWLGDLKRGMENFESNVTQAWDGFWSDVKSNASSAWNDTRTNFGNWLGDLKTKYQGWERDVETGWNNFWGNVKQGWDTLSNDIKKVWEGPMSNTKRSMVEAFKAAGIDIEGFLSDPVQKIKDAWDGLVNWFERNVTDPIQKAFSGIDIKIPTPSLPQVDVDWTRYTSGDGSWFDIPSFSWDWFAKGGFPDTGQLFVAREAGPEMVGAIGNRTAVANNDQIVEGIKGGVLEAMMQAAPLFKSDSGNGKVEVVLRVDSMTLAKAVNEGNSKLSRRGLSSGLEFV